MSLALQPGETIADKYRITKVIGKGGMGFVMAAEHMQLHRPVAIKFLHGDSDPKLVARFSREARIAGQLHSEHVCKVFDIGWLPTGEPFMVMELLRGHDLKQLVRKNGPLPLEQAVDYMLQACEALSEAHTLGVVHRDLKPGNLFVTQRPDSSECLKVLDFGISKLRDAQPDVATDLTATGAVLGSPRFISPEQLRATSDVDLRADIWALGAVLHELLSGKAAFPAKTMGELCFMILNDEPTPITELRPDVPAGVQEVLNRCMAKEAADRYANTAELALALKPFGSGGAAISVNRCKAIYEADGWTDPTSGGDGPVGPTSSAAVTPVGAPRDPLVPLGKGSIVADRFELIEILGRGGMGVVWRARQLSLDAMCAVKLIAVAGSADDLGARFQREAQVAARIRSPHVMQVIDYGVWQEHAFIAMELLEGETLRERLDRVGALSSSEVVAITSQLSHALDRAHAADIVHRDLKPDNVFLAEGGNGDHVKVFDFGVAKDRGGDGDRRSQTASGALLGTPLYMSPEQLDGLATLDHRADLWSIAIMIYECLVGSRPFNAPKFTTLVQQIVAAPIPVPSQHTDLPVAFDAWFAKAAARDTEQRYNSVREMADALADALDLSQDAALERSRRSLPPIGKVDAQQQPTAPALFDDNTIDDGKASISMEAEALQPPLQKRWGWALAGLAGLAAVSLAWIAFSGGSGAAEAPTVTPSTPASTGTQAVSAAAEPSASVTTASVEPTAAVAPSSSSSSVATTAPPAPRVDGRLPAKPLPKPATSAAAAPAPTATALETDHGF